MRIERYVILDRRKKSSLSIMDHLIIYIMLCIYIYIYMYIYIYWASKVFFNYGFIYRYDLSLIITSLMLVSIAFLSMPKTIREYSDFFLWMVYIILYIPSILSVSMQGYDSFNGYYLNSSITISFIIMVIIPRTLILGKFRPRKKVNILTPIIPIYIIIISIYIYNFRNIMTLPSFEDIYDQRNAYSTLDVSALARYLTFWLSNAINPYLIVLGLFDRSKLWVTLLGAVGQVIVFAAIALKMTIVIVLVMCLFYIYIVKNGKINIKRLLLSTLVLISIPLIIIYFTEYRPSGISLNIAALIYMRTLGIQGVMTGVYADVFSYSPLTFWSHVNIINFFVDYPYSKPLGYFVGIILVGGAGFNANANFWATDGIAAFGNTGVVIIGAFIGLLLCFADKIVTKDNLVFSSTLSIPFIMSLGNASVFTSLVTGGGVIVFMFVAFGTPEMGNGGRYPPNWHHRSQISRYRP